MYTKSKNRSISWHGKSKSGPLHALDGSGSRVLQIVPLSLSHTGMILALVGSGLQDYYASVNCSARFLAIKQACTAFVPFAKPFG